MVGIKQIAAEANVSVSTVSRYLNGNEYVSAESAQCIREIIDKYNYVPSNIARSLVLQKSNTIGLILPHMNSPFFASLAGGVEEEAKNHDYELLLCHTHEDASTEKKYVKLLYERRVDGIILIPAEYSEIQDLPSSNSIPTVFVARYKENMPYSAVYIDNIEGSKRIVNLLLKHGHRDIALIIGRNTIPSGKMRWQGALQAFSDFGIVPREDLMMECAFTAEGGFAAMNELIAREKKFSAVFTGNHIISAGCMKALNQHGVRVPEDVVMTSFDGFEDSYASFIVPEVITHNIHPSRKMGREAVKVLIEEIGQNTFTGQRIMIDMGLVIQGLRDAAAN